MLSELILDKLIALNRSNLLSESLKLSRTTSAMKHPNTYLLALLFFAPLSVFADTDRAAEPKTKAEIYGQGVRETPKLSPEEEQSGFHLPDGFEIQLVAAEPEINKPLNMAFDIRGRLWITSTLEYPYAAKEGAVPRDSIKILEDTNGDGRADKVTTFADKLNIPMGLLPVRDGVICFNIPSIYYLRDTDGDDKCDERIKLLGPFDTTRDTHGMINALRRGDDGLIYACHGFNNQSKVVAKDGSQVQLMSGNTFRFRDDGSHIHQFTQGQVNPFGMTRDEWGNWYTADCHSKPITALLHGGSYPSFGRPHDGLGFAPSMMDHLHGSTAICGLEYVQTDSFPAAFQRRFLSGNVMTSRINCNALIRSGATVTAQELPDFLTSDDPWFRPVDLQFGPDGALYVADFYNKIIGHYEVPLPHPERDRESGRIWRIVWRGDKSSDDSLTSYQSLATSPLFGLAHWQELESNDETRRRLAIERARQAGDEFTEQRISELQQKIQETRPTEQLRLSCASILWQLGKLQEKDAVQFLFESPRLVAFGLRALADKSELSQETVLAVNKIAIDAQADPQVRLAAVECLGAVGRAANVRELLSIASNETKDATLRQAARIAVRNLLKDEKNLAIVTDTWQFKPSGPTRTSITMTEKLAPELASILPALESSLAAEALLRYVESQASSNTELIQTALIKSAQFPSAVMTDSQLRLIDQVNGDNLPGKAKMVESLCAALDGKGIEYSPSLRDNSSRLMQQLVEHIQHELKTSHQIEWRDAKGSSWASEPRKLRGGSSAGVVSSITRGESYVGTLQSDEFQCPEKLSFWLCGHNGDPSKPDKQLNKVNLVEIGTNKVLQTAYPPRNDTAVEIVWDLTASKDQRVRLEVIDGDSGSAFAWLAVGRFSLAGLNGSSIGDNFGALLQLARRRVATNTAAQLQPLLTETRLNAASRAKLVGVVAEISARPLIQALVEQAQELGRADLVSANLLADDLKTQTTAQEELTKQISLTCTSKQQASFSKRLMSSAPGCDALVQLLDQGKLNLAALRGAEPVFPKGCPETIRARLISDIEKASQIADGKDQEIQARLARLNFTDASIETGRILFEKRCATCHQLAGKGVLIGPQLDGAGRRSYERLCEDVLDPNRNVDTAFRMSSLLLENDQVVTGLVKEQADGTLQLTGQDGKTTTIAPATVGQRRDSTKSLMPDNFGEVLSDDELAALLHYLVATSNSAN